MSLSCPIVQVTSNKHQSAYLPSVCLPVSLPGYSDSPTKFYCGQVYGVDRCNNSSCANVERVFKHVCNNWDCPVCFLDTVNRQSKRSTDRVLGVGRALKDCGINSGSVVHVVISPPPEYVNPSASGLELMKKQASDYLSQIGMIGFTPLLHPYRIKKDITWQLKKSYVIVPFNASYVDRFGVKPLYMDDGSTVLKIPAIAFYGGLWACVQKDILNLGGLEYYVEWSPHIHAIGYLPKMLIKSDDFYKLSGGWIYKNKGKRKSVLATYRYLLTHCALIPGKQIVTYHGCMSYSKVRVQKTVSYEDIKCSCCASSCTRYKYVDDINGVLSYSRAMDCGSSVKKVVTSLYWLHGVSASVPYICDKDRFLMISVEALPSKNNTYISPSGSQKPSMDYSKDKVCSCGKPATCVSFTFDGYTVRCLNCFEDYVNDLGVFI